MLWSSFIPVAILNGTIKNFLYAPYVGELPAHQISTLTGVLSFFFLAYLFLKKLVQEISQMQILIAGLALVMMTIIFEFIFDHYVLGHS